MALNIATAANMQYVMHELTAEFTKQESVACNLVVSSSGKLTAQIKEGAPYHIFLSADMKYPEEIFNSGFATTKPEIYAYGKLILLSCGNNQQPTFKTLLHTQNIAIANPKTAPYGKAAIEVLQQNGLMSEVNDKLVYGESVAQTNQFILSQSAQAGFTSIGVLGAPGVKEKCSWMEINPASYTAITQGVVLLKTDHLAKEAKLFYTFLFSEKARQILKKHGYNVDE